MEHHFHTKKFGIFFNFYVRFATIKYKFANTMKQIVASLIIAMLLCGCGTGAIVQQKPIVSQQAVFEDYLPILENAGYMVYSFDISGLQDSMKTLTLDVREYEYGERTGYNSGAMGFPNMVMLSNYTEADQERILADGLAAVPERGIYKLSGKLTLSFYPGMDDSMVVLRANVENIGEWMWGLPLRPLESSSQESDDVYKYGHRPYELDSLEEGEFIPLVMYGSFWKDGAFYRFCGEKFLPSDMSSQMMKYVPHYYVIGVTIGE